ncbi:head completion/stabilization protein [Halodesulfovibrio aestuarii]|uniref:Head completion/stabilization protein n=1 Tax=Halodesulfovibrio aestuarii TaxID=126333 RepID=A0ABV4JSW5_9BACT
MTAFSGHTSTASTAVVQNDGFWPEISVAEFQEIYRLPRDYAEPLLVNHLKLGVVWANRQLAEWKREVIMRGHGSLASMPEDEQGGALGDETTALLHYKRAVFSYAKALLLPQFATINRREAARNEARESEETTENFLAYAEQAIADFLGSGRVDVELI